MEDATRQHGAARIVPRVLSTVAALLMLLPLDGPRTLRGEPVDAPAPLVVVPADDAEAHCSPFAAALVDAKRIEGKSEKAKGESEQAPTYSPTHLLTYSPHLQRQVVSLEGFRPDQPPLTTHPSLTNRPGDELWYISSRHLPAPDPHGRLHRPPALRVWRNDPSTGGEMPSSLAEFLATDDPTAITCIYAHGARVTEPRAFARLPLIYEALAGDFPPEARVRMVLFSWPNPKSIRVLQDFRTAEQIATPHGKYLAWLLENLAPDDHVSLLSFSLGAQVVTAALDDLSDRGCLADRRPMRVVMWTAAESNTWILPGGRHGRAMTAVDRLLLIKNSCDPLLRRYFLMSPDKSPQALGYRGVARLDPLGEMALKIRQIDAGPSLGYTHAYRRHIEAPRVVALTRPYIFWQDVDQFSPMDAPRELVSASGATAVSAGGAAGLPPLYEAANRAAPESFVRPSGLQQRGS